MNTSGYFHRLWCVLKKILQEYCSKMTCLGYRQKLRHISRSQIGGLLEKPGEMRVARSFQRLAAINKNGNSAAFLIAGGRRRQTRGRLSRDHRSPPRGGGLRAGRGRPLPAPPPPQRGPAPPLAAAGGGQDGRGAPRGGAERSRAGAPAQAGPALPCPARLGPGAARRRKPSP